MEHTTENLIHLILCSPGMRGLTLEQRNAHEEAKKILLEGHRTIEERAKILEALEEFNYDLGKAVGMR